MTLTKVELNSQNSLGPLPGYVASTEFNTQDAGVVVIQEVFFLILIKLLIQTTR